MLRGKDSVQLQHDITFSFPFSHLSRDHYISKQHWLPLLSTVDKMADVYWLFIPWLWFPCSARTPKTWLHHLPESLAFVFFYTRWSPCQHSWQKLRACHFLLSHTKNGRLPNAKTLDHGRTSQRLQCPLENKKSENRGSRKLERSDNRSNKKTRVWERGEEKEKDVFVCCIPVSSCLGNEKESEWRTGGQSRTLQHMIFISVEYLRVSVCRSSNSKRLLVSLCTCESLL